MIQLKNINKTLDQQVVLNNITVEFQEGKIHGIVGRNGCGKSMLFRLICGLIYPDNGTITLTENQDKTPSIGALIEKPKFLENLSGIENLSILASINHQISENEIKDWMKRFGLEKEQNKKYGKYSLGMKQKLGIIQAVMEHPDIVILDEPFNGLDNNSVEIVRQLLLELKKEKKTIFIASHIKDDILLLCDRVYEMDAGKIIDAYDNIESKNSKKKDKK